MSVNLIWAVYKMDCAPSYGGQTDVVINIYWSLTGTSGSIIEMVYGVTSIDPKIEETFTPYAELTEPQVLGWVKGALGPEQVALTESLLTQRIEEQLNPSVVTPPLPWEQQ